MHADRKWNGKTMSVLIKGMDIPKDYEIKITLFPNGQVFIDNGVYFLEYEAVEVPTPHGRLIDVDKLLKNKTDHDTISTHLVWNAPTVIESED